MSEQLLRRLFGCDMSHKYNEWAIERVENTIQKNKNAWSASDRAIESRRNSIR